VPEGSIAEVSVMRWGPKGLETFRPTGPAEILALRPAPPSTVTWVDVAGVDRATLDALTKTFHLHPLAMEDAVHTHQRAKVEAYPGHDLLIARMISTADDEPVSEQVSFFIGDGFVVTMQEREGDPFQPVRARIAGGEPRLREGGADILVYALIDSIVDHYFPMLADIGERIEALEAEILAAPRDENLTRVQAIRRLLIMTRRNIWPMRDAVQNLVRAEFPFVTPTARVYLRDTLDHLMRIVDLIESYREMATGLMDLHMSVLNMRMGKVMQVLAVISTIFIPLTFIAGVYGMNFDPESSALNMPELKSQYGYPIALSVMGVIASVLLWLFWRRGWIGSGRGIVRRHRDS